MEGRVMHAVLSTVVLSENPESTLKKLLHCAHAVIRNRCCPLRISKLEQSFNGDPNRFATNLFDAIDADVDCEYQFFQFVNVSLHFDPVAINNRMFEIEADIDTLRQDVLALVKLFFAFNDGSDSRFELVDVDPSDWGPLKEKYCFDEKDLAKIAWTYPYLSLMILTVYEHVERPVRMEMMSEYINFKPQFRFVGLFGLVPPRGRYGGFVKALLHHTVLQVAVDESKETESHADTLKFIIGLALAIYHSRVDETLPRDEFIKFLGISDSDCIQWTEVFNRQYPAFIDVHIKYFEQLE